jgi:peptidoglycan/LPS O-acetylase OafA/YrhL
MNIPKSFFIRFFEQYDKADKLLISRGMACVAVFMFHALLSVKGISEFGQNGVGFEWQSIFWFDGLAGVSMFFVLSGYLMGKAFLTGRYALDLPGFTRFWTHRARRILPLYYFVLLVLVVFMYPFVMHFNNWNLLRSALLFYYHYRDFVEVPFNIVLWTLTVEVQFYLVLPFLMLAIKPLSKRKWAVLAGIVGLVFWIALRSRLEANLQFLSSILNWPLLQTLEIFLMGIGVFGLLQSFPVIRQLAAKFSWLAWICLACLYLITSLNLFYEHRLIGDFLQPKYMLTTILLSCGFVYFTEARELERKPVKFKLDFQKLITNPFHIWEFLGEISYGFYLWHYPVIASVQGAFLLTKEDLNLISFLARTLLMFILSLVLSGITYYAIELPAMNWGRKSKSLNPIQTTPGP